MEAVIQFTTNNIAYILLAAAVLYFVWFIYSIVQSKKNNERFHFRFKYFFCFLVIIVLAVYCLATGKSLSTFIN